MILSFYKTTGVGRNFVMVDNRRFAAGAGGLLPLADE